MLLAQASTFCYVPLSPNLLKNMVFYGSYRNADTILFLDQICLCIDGKRIVPDQFIYCPFIFSMEVSGEKVFQSYQLISLSFRHHLIRAELDG